MDLNRKETTETKMKPINGTVAKTIPKGEGVKEKEKDSKFERGGLFDVEFQTLLDKCKDVLSAREGNITLNVPIVNPIVRSLNNYIKTYKERTEPEEHVEYIQQIFKANRISILKGDRSWLEKNISIQYLNIAKIKVHLSKIYNTSLQLQRDSEKRLEGPHTPEEEEKIELIYPDILYLHLLRLFREVTDVKDSASLDKLILSLENELGIKRANSTGTSNSNPLQAMGLETMISQATDILKECGVKPPEGTSFPSANEIVPMFSNLLKDERVKGFMSMVVNGMKSGNTTELINSMVGLVGDPNLKNAIMSTIEQATQGGLRQPGPVGPPGPQGFTELPSPSENVKDVIPK